MVVTRRWRRKKVFGRTAPMVVWRMGWMIGRVHVQKVLVVLGMRGRAFSCLGLPFSRLALCRAVVVLLRAAAKLMVVKICGHGNRNNVGQTARYMDCLFFVFPVSFLNPLFKGNGLLFQLSCLTCVQMMQIRSKPKTRPAALRFSVPRWRS